MPLFRHSFMTDDGVWLSGQIEAADRDEALARLAAQGLEVERIELVEASPDAAEPAPTPRSKILASADAELLAAELSGLVRSGLPLPEGLRALAQELGQDRVAEVLRELARRIESGESLDAALEAIGRRLPGHLRGLIQAGLASGRMSDLLEEYVDLRREQSELRRRMWTAVAYPLILMAILAAVGILFGRLLVPQFAGTFRDFDAELPAMTDLIIRFYDTGIWWVLGAAGLLVGLFLFALLGPAPLWLRLCAYETPLLGPFWRWGRLVPFARLMALFVEHQVPLPAALRFTAAGLADRHLAAGCVHAAEEVESGRSLGEGLASAGPFPRGIIPLFEWGGRFGSLAAAFHFVAASFEGHAQKQAAMARILFLPTALVTILVVVGFHMIALVLPLIKLIETLSK